MKKTLVIVIIVLLPALVLSDTTFHDCGNVVYIGIYPRKKSGIFGKTEKISSGTISNYLIYNTVTKEKKYIFPDDPDRNISEIVFEKYYDPVKKEMVFNITGKNRGHYYEYKDISSLLINNTGIEQREPLDSVLFEVRYETKDKLSESVKIELWKCKKDGIGLILLATITAGVDAYRIDVKNKKVIIVRQTLKTTEIETRDW